jgi:hypothetical protein
MRTFVLLGLLGAFALGGCRTTTVGASETTSRAAEALSLEEDSSALRDRQTRKFETTDERAVLQASAALLQDLGFNLDEAEPEVGLLVASKDRSAVVAGEVAGAIFASVVLSLIFQTDVEVPWDEKQLMRASVISRPVQGGVVIRVTFQRLVWNNKGSLARLEPLQEPEHYIEFFDRLAESVFLEAEEL